MNKLCNIKSVLASISQLEDQFSREFNLTLNEALCLCTVKEGPLDSTFLAESLMVSPSRLSRILGNLEKKQLIKRELLPENHRKRLVKLTKEGQHKINLVHQSNISIPNYKIIP